MNPTEEQTYRSNVVERLKRIEGLQIATNGRVRWTEKMIYLAVGGMGVLALMFIPSLGWLFIQVVHNSSQISLLIAKVQK